ncbi:hypothetical protein BHYA_0170g00180 [Botrytis hyacinthi]|uniref:Heterokaryon incompatibility domain-containing protein n=1 Tax=Botrytis hyacinthi TaxID=278943 RepID=A0A4Z1GDR3_9HELO|nr:hypothetical protein BHYA_0170g00180 [Botrytis hyacinthi]
MKRFSYKPLDPLVDGIRLLNLLPGNSTQQPRCSLKHVNFGERPKYNAVSYTWGNEADQKPIFIDDRYFLVTENLYKALICLQQQGAKEYVLWVDAICINQDDVAERNRQLTIMPYIYERAKLVIIWLRNDENVSRPAAWPDPEKISPFEISGHTQQYKDQRSLFNYLMIVCSNEYWKRLWIIQEIGKARKLIIFFGHELIDWQRFVETITLDWPYPAWMTQETMEENALSQTVPWSLYYQLRNKYDGGHKLQNLMANHRQALCKEPRDKVYGLVGLATDCYAGFPMDYRKTLYEVWKDTVLFRNSDTRVHQSDILKFGKLVRDSLGGPNITTMKEIADDVFLKIPQKSSIERHLGVSNPTVLKVPARLVGRIVHLGPSYVQIMTELSKTADWRLNIQNYLPDRLQPSVQEESDLFLELLEDLDETGLKIVSTSGSDVSWLCERFPGENCYPFDRPTDRDIGDESLLRNSSFHSSSERSEPLPPSPVKGARLFLLDKYVENLLIPNDALANMGLGPSAACVGDYLCEIDGIKKAAVVRRTKTKLSFIGTAGLAQKPQDARKSKNSTFEETSSPFGLPKFENLTSDETVDLYLYVPLAYQLLD